MEEWMDIPGFDGLYQVSNFGRIKSLPRVVRNYSGYYLTKARILKPYDRKGKWYCTVSLYDGVKRKGFDVHRLVAIAFLPNPKNLPMVNHKDGVKNNNHVDNLEWCTASENIFHSVNILGKRSKILNGLFGSENGNAKVQDKIHEILMLRQSGLSTKKIGRHFDVHQSTIQRILKKKNEAHEKTITAIFGNVRNGEYTAQP